MNLCFFRAVTLTALLFLSPLGHTKSSRTETYRDIIEKAHNLSLQNERPQGLRVLSAAINKETRPQAIAELKKSAKELSQVFLSDKAQQLYESSLSLKKANPAQALDKINEALKAEPDNSVILLEQSRQQMSRGECRAALADIQAQLNLVPSDDDLILAQAQALVCLGSWKEYEKAKAKVGAKKTTTSEYWLALDASRQIELKNFSKAQELLSQIQKISEKYPEQYYWQQLLEQRSKKSFAVSGQKYVMSCKNISVTMYRQYMIDPMLCRRVSEVEADLKGLHATSD